MSNSDKKVTRSRVQGGWANSKSSNNVDKQPKESERKFVYQDVSDTVTRERPPDIVIDKDQTFELSETENGVSKVTLIRNFFDQSIADEFFERLEKELPWQVRVNKKYNTEEPRLSCWLGEHPYIYSGVDWPALPLLPITEIINTQLYQALNHKFNSVMANLYRDGHDTVSWHSDDEPMLGKHPYIASLSFGDNRMFELRRKLPLGSTDEDYKYVQHVRVPLTHGSLLIMEGATQDDWQHQIPREYHDRGPRINLTYRIIYPTEEEGK